MRLESLKVGSRVEVKIHNAQTFGGPADEEPFTAIVAIDTPEDALNSACVLLHEAQAASRFLHPDAPPEAKAEAIRTLARIFGDEIRYDRVALPELIVGAALHAVGRDQKREVVDAVMTLVGSLYDSSTGERAD